MASWLTGGSALRIREVQTVEAQLLDSGSNTVKNSDKSILHEQKILKNKYSELTIEKYYKEQNFLSFFAKKNC
jgi:hypothetical protein